MNTPLTHQPIGWFPCNWPQGHGLFANGLLAKPDAWANCWTTFVEVMLGFRIDLPKSWFLSANPGRLGGLTFQQWNLWICSQFSGSSTPCRIGVSWCLYILYSVLRMGSLYYIRPIWLSHSVRWSSVPRTRVNLTIFDLSAAVPVKLFQFASNSIV